jgi:hypothetical protein
MDTYRSIHDTYRWTLKTYPGTDYLVNPTCMDDPVGTVTTIRYRKSGSRWVETKTETEEISRRYYFNSVDAVPFFRSLGGREIVSMCYTRYGYIPYEVISINPDRTERIRRTFRFD